MELPISCDTTEGVVIRLHPHSSPTTEFPSGQPVALVGPVVIAKESGDGDFTQVSALPDQFELLSGPAAGVSVFTATGTDAAGNTAMDRYTLTVSLFVPPAPALADLGSVSDQPIKK